jgi:prophage regulatory protein
METTSQDQTSTIPLEVQKNSTQLLRIDKVSEITTLAKSSINLWVAQGKFPKPIMLSPVVKVWKLGTIIDWINQKSESL